MNTVTRVVLERDAADCVQRFGSEWSCPGGTTVRLEPTAENVFVVEADCNMGKTYATLTYIGAALKQNPSLPLIHISSRRTHGRAIDEDCRTYYPPELKMCFYLDETQKDRQRKCMTSKRLIISAEQIAIGRLGSVDRFCGGVLVMDELNALTTTIGCGSRSATVKYPDLVIQLLRSLAGVVDKIVVLDRDITLTGIPAFFLSLVCPNRNVLHALYKRPGMRNVLCYAFDCKSENECKPARGRTLAMQHFRLHLRKVRDTFVAAEEHYNPDLKQRLWVHVGEIGLAQPLIDIICEMGMSYELYCSTADPNVVSEHLKDTDAAWEDVQVIISTVTIMVSINVYLRFLCRWNFTSNKEVATADAVTQNLLRVGRGRDECQRQHRLADPRIFTVFMGCPPDSQDLKTQKEMSDAEYQRSVERACADGRRLATLEESSRDAAREHGGLTTAQIDEPLSSEAHQLILLVKNYSAQHVGRKHVSRYFEVALKNGFEQSMEMPPLTLDEIGELENGGVRGTWWSEDDDKRVASFGHDWGLIYNWFRTNVIEDLAHEAYEVSEDPNRTIKKSIDEVLTDFGKRDPRIVPVSVDHGGLPRDELTPSSRAILDIFTAARAYRTSHGNSAGCTIAHIFKLRPFDANVEIGAENGKMPDAEAFVYLFKSRQAMRVLAMLRHLTSKEIRVEYERGMALKNNSHSDKGLSCHRELRVSELQLVDGVERLARMLASVHIRAVPAHAARRDAITRSVLQKLVTHALEGDVSFDIDTPEGAWLAAHNRLAADERAPTLLNEAKVSFQTEKLGCKTPADFLKAEQAFKRETARIKAWLKELRVEEHRAGDAQLKKCVLEIAKELQIRYLGNTLTLTALASKIVGTVGMKLQREYTKTGSVVKKRKTALAEQAVTSVRIVDVGCLLFDEHTSPAECIKFYDPDDEKMPMKPMWQLVCDRRQNLYDTNLQNITCNMFDDDDSGDPGVTDESDDEMPDVVDAPQNGLGFQRQLPPGAFREQYSAQGLENLVLQKSDIANAARAAHDHLESKLKGLVGGGAHPSTLTVLESDLRIFARAIHVSDCIDAMDTTFRADSSNGHHCQIVQYSKRDGYGRRYARGDSNINVDRSARAFWAEEIDANTDTAKTVPRNICLQGMPRDLRAPLVGDRLCDIDIRKCFPNLILSFARQNGIEDRVSAMRDFVENAGEWVDEIVSFYGLTGDSAGAAKILVNSLINGGGVRKWAFNHSASRNSRTLKPRLKQLKQQMLWLRGFLLTTDPFKNDMAARLERLKTTHADSTEEEHKRRVFALWLNELEDCILKSVETSIELVNDRRQRELARTSVRRNAGTFKVEGLVFDGLLIEPPPGTESEQKEAMTKLLDAVQKRLADEGWPDISLVEKPLRGTQNDALPSFQYAADALERLRQHDVEFAQVLNKHVQPEPVPDSPSAASSSSVRRNRVMDDLGREEEEFMEELEQEEDVWDRQLDAYDEAEQGEFASSASPSPGRTGGSRTGAATPDADVDASKAETEPSESDSDESSDESDGESLHGVFGAASDDGSEDGDTEASSDDESANEDDGESDEDAGSSEDASDNENASVASRDAPDAEGASPPPSPHAGSARARPESSCDEDDSDDEAVAQPYKRRRCGHRSRRVDSDSE